MLESIFHTRTLGVSLTKRFYRPELDAVRFCAFLSVFLHHLGSREPGSHSAVVLAVQNALGFGLCLFFTLSSYLIATLLMREKNSTGDISLTKFYQRRMLRIWPLYFFALALGAALTALQGRFASQEKWFLLALVMAGNIGPRPETVMAHMWSISIEEQFYVLWPGLSKFLNRKTLLAIACVMILVSNVALVHYAHIHADTDATVWSSSLVQFEMFAAGILLALLESAEEPAVVARAAALLFVPAAWFIATYYLHIKAPLETARNPVPLCLGYGLVALSCAVLIYAVKGMQSWPRDVVYLGKISYGLYVFHALALRVTHHFNPLARGVVAFVLTVAAASASYRYFETPFLKLKEKLEVIRSRPIEVG